jgi:SAM-dependent methyltransferase
MSREKNLPRLNDWSVRSKDPHYIHYYFLISDVKEALETYARGNFLDLGCGNKPYETIYNSLTKRQTGCDAIQSDKNRVEVICLATDLKFESNSFDSILCTQVMEHVYDHNTMMKEIFRVLKPGGHIVLTVPFAWELHEEPYDFFRFTPHALKELFTVAGLQIDYIKPNGGMWAAIYQLRNNIRYHSFRTNKNFFTRLKKFLFMELRLTQLYNHFAIWLDKKSRNEILTLNYIIVAHKPA